MRPVDLAGDGKWLLFVARDQGDHLLVCDAKSRNFTDITAARRLQSKSQAFAWGDFGGQGRLDLISFDGRRFHSTRNRPTARSRPAPLDLAGALENGCIGLAALDCGSKGKSGLLVSTNSWPVLVSFEAGGKPSLSRLAAPGVELDEARPGRAVPGGRFRRRRRARRPRAVCRGQRAVPRPRARQVRARAPRAR